MKWGLLLAIRIYWLLWPRSRRRQCLFAESCSVFVYRHARQLGLLAGLRALRGRIKHCRSGWEICTTADGIGLGLHLVDGTVIPEAEWHLPCWRHSARRLGSWKPGCPLRLRFTE